MQCIFLAASSPKMNLLSHFCSYNSIVITALKPVMSRRYANWVPLFVYIRVSTPYFLYTLGVTKVITKSKVGSLKPRIHEHTEWFANHSRMICEPNARICGRDCKPALRHLRMVRMPFAANQNLSFFCTNTKRIGCVGCTLLASGSWKINETEYFLRCNLQNMSSLVCHCTECTHTHPVRSCTLWLAIHTLVLLVNTKSKITWKVLRNNLKIFKRKSENFEEYFLKF